MIFKNLVFSLYLLIYRQKVFFTYFINQILNNIDKIHTYGAYTKKKAMVILWLYDKFK